MMVITGYSILLLLVLGTEASRIYKDPGVLERIPEDLRRSIDESVARRLQRAISTHFDEADSYGMFQSGMNVPESGVIVRHRRDVTNATGNSSAVFSDWAEYGACSAKCGGGQQVRYRSCLQGNCKEIGPYTEARKCGMYPCVTGSYVLSSINAFGNIPIPDAKMVKFFSIQGARYFGYITRTELHILKWSNAKNGYVAHQTIPVTSGIGFDILNTYPRTYLVVIEKALMIFPGRFSKMYYYDPWNSFFQTTSPVTIDVWEPSAVKTFDVFGTAFLGIVNYQTKMASGYSATNELLVCSGQTKVASCPMGSIITVTSAIYGRVTNYECATGVDIFVSWYQYFATCVVPGTKVKVSKICDNKQSCELTADPVHFVDPSGISCAQTNNYLRITYTCSSISHLGMPIFYKWDGVGLSLISSRKLITYGAKDIEAFTIHDQQYIAVANYRNDKGEHHLDSEIYIYNLDSGRFSSLQKIRTDGAVDWEFFAIGSGLSQEYFLVVANHVKILPNGVITHEVDSVIYKWNWNLFVPFQCIRTYGAKKWTALKGEKGRFTLSVTNIYGNTSFYNYDGWRFNRASVQPEDEIFVNAEALYAHEFQVEPMFLVQNKKALNGSRNLYKTTFMKTFPKHELLETTVRAVQEMNRSVYEIVLPDTKIFNESYKVLRKDIVFLDNVTFAEHKIFKNIHVQGNTTVDSANITSLNLPSTDIEGNMLEVLNGTITAMYAVLDDAVEVLGGVVTKSTEQVIDSKKSFTNLTVSRMNISKDVEVGHVNGMNLSDIKDRAIYINENTTISSRLTFNDVKVQHLYVDNTIDNVHPEAVVTTDRNGSILGIKKFMKINFVGNEDGDITARLVNGVDTKHILTVAGDQIINSSYLFHGKVYTINVSVSDTINNGNFTEMMQDTVMINDASAVIKARKQFRKFNVLGDLELRENATVNGIDISDLLNIGVNLGADNIGGTVTFVSNVTFLSNITVMGSVNGVNISDVIYTNVDSVIYSPLIITGNVSAVDVVVNTSINGYNMSNILFTVGNQTITGYKTFTSNLEIIDDVETTGKVDGIDISAAYERTLLMNKTQNVTGYKEIGELTIDQLNCTNCSFLSLLSSISEGCARSSKVVNVTGHKHFKHLHVDGSVHVAGSVNGIVLPGDLLIQGRNQTITGNHSFQHSVSAKNVSAGSINGITLSSIYGKALYKSNLTIKNLSFQYVNVRGDLSVNKTIDGIDLEDVVLTYSNQTVTGRKTFVNDISVGHLIAGRVETYGLIDGVNLTELNEELLTLTGDQIVLGTKVFERGVSFLGNWSIASMIDGVNITELYNNAMTLDSDQTVTGQKMFVEEVQVTKNISVGKLVDNVNLTDLSLHAINSIDGHNQTISGTVTFNDITLVSYNQSSGLNVSGLITGVNLTDFIGDTLMKSGNQVVTGGHHITNLTVTGVTDVQGTVNGVDLSNEVVTLHGNTTIPGTKVFTSDMKMDAVSMDTVNGINMTEFDQRVAYIDEDTVITGFLTIANNLSMDGNLLVSQLINGVNLTNVMATTVFQDGEQTVKGPVYFAEVTFKNILNSNLFNEMNFSVFAENVVYKCIGPNKPIQGYLNFSKVNFDRLSITRNLEVEGLINELNLTILDKQIVKQTGNFTIDGLKRIDDDMSVGNLSVNMMNGFQFPADFVRLDGEDTIEGKKTFMDVVTVKKIELSQVINGINITAIANSMVKLDGNQTVTSEVLFQKNITVHGNLNTHLVNGLNISRDELFMSTGNQTVTASKIFADVYVEGEVVSGNNINGFDLKQMQNESFISGVENVLRGVITIIGNVTIRGNLDSGALDGVKNISSQFYGFNRISAYLRSHIPKIYESISENRAIIKQISASVTNIHQSLDYFIDDQEINLPYVSTSIDILLNGDKAWLAAGAVSDPNGVACFNTSVFVRSRSDVNFQRKHSVLSNAVTDVKFIKSSGKIYLASASNRRNLGCLPNTPNTEQSATYGFNENSKDFKILASTRTHRATGVDVLTGNNVEVLFTNTYGNSSTCVEQTLHALNNSFFELRGSVKSCNVIKSIIVQQNDRETTIAVLGSDTDGYRQLQVIDILKNGTTIVKQVIATYYASDVLHFINDGWSFIAIANTYDSSEEALSVSYTVPVVIYRSDASGLYEHYQDIEVWSALKVQSIKIGIYSYLAIATYEQEILILKHKGASKWNVALKVPIQGYGSINDVKAWSFDNEIYMAVLSSDIWNIKYPSKIRIMKGFLTSAVEGSSIMKLNI